GELDASEHRGWGRLALHLDGKAAVKAQQLMLFDTVDTHNNDPVPQYVEVDHRGDCKQVCIGLVATQDGFPLAYEVFSGNRADVTTVEEMVEIMESKYGRAQIAQRRKLKNDICAEMFGNRQQGYKNDTGQCPRAAYHKAHSLSEV
ncbi:unnamed protein product, partial [marine sediment metagenome]